eukprot:407504-Amphidinium_carterae.1
MLDAKFQKSRKYITVTSGASNKGCTPGRTRKHNQGTNAVISFGSFAGIGGRFQSEAIPDGSENLGTYLDQKVSGVARTRLAADIEQRTTYTGGEQLRDAYRDRWSVQHFRRRFNKCIDSSSSACIKSEHKVLIQTRLLCCLLLMVFEKLDSALSSHVGAGLSECDMVTARYKFRCSNGGHCQRDFASHHAGERERERQRETSNAMNPRMCQKIARTEQTKTLQNDEPEWNTIRTTPQTWKADSRVAFIEDSLPEHVVPIVMFSNNNVSELHSRAEHCIVSTISKCHAAVDKTGSGQKYIRSSLKSIQSEYFEFVSCFLGER